MTRLSFRQGLAMEREGLMVSSSAGMVLVSSRQGTVPFSFSSSIWGEITGLRALEGQESPHNTLLLEQTGSLGVKVTVGHAG